MRAMKIQFLDRYGYDDWRVSPDGVLLCPHGEEIQDDLRTSHYECGCVSPLTKETYN